MLYPVQIKSEEKVAFIDADGETRLEVAGQRGFGVLETRAFVGRGGELVLIDPKGQELASVQANRAHSFVNGYCIVEKLNHRTGRLQKGLIDLSGRWLAEPAYANITDVYEGHYARREAETDLYSLFSVTGKRVLESFDLCATRVAEGVIAAGKPDEIGKLGYRRLDGTWLIPPAFDTARPFSCGVAAVIRRVKDSIKALFVERTGTEMAAFPEIEAFGECFSDGAIGFHSPQTSGYLDQSGKRIVEGRFSILGLMQHRAAPVKSEGKWGLIGRDGEWRLKPQFDRMYEQLGPFFVFREESSFGPLRIVNPEGKVIWPRSRSLPFARHRRR